MQSVVLFGTPVLHCRPRR